MIVYHGSNSNFKTLRISKSLVKHNSTLNNEGLGIYFSTNIEVARSYGKYIYTLEINYKEFQDFRKLTVCKNYVIHIMQDVYKATKVDLSAYLYFETVSNYMYYGGLAITGVCREIYLQLDSNEFCYRLPKTKIESVYKRLNYLSKHCPKVFMFNYHIKDIGVIKDVSPDVIRIINKQLSY